MYPFYFFLLYLPTFILLYDILLYLFYFILTFDFFPLLICFNPLNPTHI
jgi:hypothetical protein